jgi:hypothetical protein
MIKQIYSKLYKHIFHREIIDFVGYEYLIHLIKINETFKLKGDFCEIGVFCGGGTYKLAKSARKFGKKVYACDIFDYTFDNNVNTNNTPMSALYKVFLKNKTQMEIFLENIGPVKEAVIIKKGDSKNLEINSKLCFSFIDGCHSYDYVISDFEKVFSETVCGGLIGFHDYGFDLPEVTGGINYIIGKYKDKLNVIDINNEKHTIFLKKIKI